VNDYESSVVALKSERDRHNQTSLAAILLDPVVPVPLLEGREVGSFDDCRLDQISLMNRLGPTYSTPS
jgi:hypothetical protein